MSYNSIEVRVQNNTNNFLELEEAHLDHGIWANKPESIPSGDNGVFKANSCNRRTSVGGIVTWIRHGDKGVFSIEFNKPGRDGTTKFLVTSPDNYRYVISGDPLDQHAEVSVTFSRLV